MTYQPADGVDLYWVPLGAGEPLPVTRLSGRAFEHLAARRHHRDPVALFHAALLVYVEGVRTAIEMAPAWGNKVAERGVTLTGPVGLHGLGRSRYFRYEVRRWRGGSIPDIRFAVGGPVRVASDRQVATRLLDAVPDFPTATWGRDELRAGEMWNSNSLAAWLLERAGIDASQIAPPSGGRAPGWSAGVVVARRASGNENK